MTGRPTTASSTGSVMRRVEEEEPKFSLAATKEAVFKEYAEGAPGRFKKFFNTPLFDRLLHNCVLLFVARFQMDALEKSIEKYLRIKDDDKAAAAADRILLLGGEVEEYRANMSPLYGSILMNYSDYKNPHQDNLFFETLYNVLNAILKVAFISQRNDAAIEVELGLIFRTGHFNLADRSNRPPRSVDTLSLRELHALKNDPAQLNMNAKMLTALTEKPSAIGVQRASVATSELIDRICRQTSGPAAKANSQPARYSSDGTGSARGRLNSNRSSRGGATTRQQAQRKAPAFTPEPSNRSLERDEAEQVHGENSATMVGKQQMSASARKMSEQQQQVASLSRRISELETMKAGLAPRMRRA